MAAAGLMLASCQGGASSDGQASSGDLKNATPADSLIYYFGQMRGAEYRRQAERDTTLADAQAKKAYLQGVQAGMNAVKSADEAYDNGHIFYKIFVELFRTISLHRGACLIAFYSLFNISRKIK